MTPKELRFLAFEVAKLQDMPVTAKKLAEMTGLTQSAIYHMVERKELPVIRHGRSVFFSPMDVAEVLRAERY